MTSLSFPDAGDAGAGHQIDLIACLDELNAIAMYTDGAAVPLTMIRIAARQLEPAIGHTWKRALEEAAAAVEQALDKTKTAALRADERARAAMQAGETFLAQHKAMETEVRNLRKRTQE